MLWSVEASVNQSSTILNQKYFCSLVVTIMIVDRNSDVKNDRVILRVNAFRPTHLDLVKLNNASDQRAVRLSGYRLTD